MHVFGTGLITLPRTSSSSSSVLMSPLANTGAQAEAWEAGPLPFQKLWLYLQNLYLHLPHHSPEQHHLPASEKQPIHWPLCLHLILLQAILQLQPRCDLSDHCYLKDSLQTSAAPKLVPLVRVCSE